MKNAIYKHLPLLLILAFSTASVQARIEPTGIKNQPSTLSFKENKGQVVDQYGNPRNDIQYKLDANGMNIFAGNGELHYQWHKNAGDNKETIYRMDVSLVGANKNAQIVQDKALQYTEYYYTAGAAEALTIHTYNKITYKDIYPNIDWVLYIKDNQLKYDFVVHPGGDTKKIQLRYDGTNNLKLQNGSIIAETPFGSVTEQKPFSYDAETKKEIPSDFVLLDNVLSFGIGKNSGDIVIDPALFWSTYYGGSGGEDGRAVGADASGNVVFAGQTSSTSNIATFGAFQTALSGVGSNAYIVKFNSLGVRQWGTYYGSSQTDFSAVHIDLSGNVYAAGSSTATTGISSGGAYQTAMAGVRDAILVKFNSTGTRQWATYYGGAAYDEALAIDIDPSGNVYMGGRTFSTSGIASVGAYQTTLSSVNGTWEDGFVAKFNSSGARQWATYYGGDTIDYVKGLAVDASGNVYIGGQTYSTTAIATVGAYQTSKSGSITTADGFLAMLNTSGVRQWGTYYGGTNTEIINAVATDILGYVYVTGTTNSTSGIASPSGVQQTSLFGGTDAFLAKFNTAGARQWGSYFGWTGNEEGLGLGVNTAGTIYFAGTTNSTTNISTTGNFQTSLAGGVDNYIEKFGPTGLRQEGTYFGGSGTEYACAFAYSDAGMLFLGGYTTSNVGITSIGSHQSSFGGGTTDGFLAAFNVTDTVAAIAQPFTDTIKCAGDNLLVTFGVTSTFRPGNVFSVQLSNVFGSFASPTTIGTLTTSNGGTISCTIPAVVASGTGYRIRIVSTLPVKTSADNGKNISIGTKPVNLVATGTSPACTGRTLNLTATTTTTPVTYSWVGPNSYTSGVQNPTITNLTTTHSGDYIVTATNNQCSSKDTVTVTVYNTPTLPVLSANAPCEGDTLKLTASNTTPAASAYSWTGPNTFTAGTQNPIIAGVTTAASGTYKVVATSSNGCNSDTANVVVTIQAAPVKPVATSTSPICSGNTLNLYATTTTTGVTYTWVGPNGFSASTQNPVINNADTLATGNYIVSANIGACSRTDTVAVTVNFTHTPSLSITSNPTNPTAADTVTFTASMTGCNTTPVYLWKKNGYFVLGVTGATWTVSGLSATDTINGVGVCNDPCAIPQTVSSNAIGIAPVGVHNIPNNLNVALYPNPNNGNFTIAGNVGNEKAIIAEVLNTVGQVVYQEKLTPANNYINKTISVSNMSAGIYILRLRGEESSKLIRFTLEH